MAALPEILQETVIYGAGMREVWMNGLNGLSCTAANQHCNTVQHAGLWEAWMTGWSRIPVRIKIIVIVYHVGVREALTRKSSRIPAEIVTSGLHWKEILQNISRKEYVRETERWDKPVYFIEVWYEISKFILKQQF